MKGLSIGVFFMLIGFCSAAQPAKYWGQLTAGKFAVGYQDTVLVNEQQQYSLGTYTGPKPYFIKTWFPLEVPSGKKMVYQDYLNPDSLPEIEFVADSTAKIQYEAFLKWGVTYNHDLWESEELTELKENLAARMLGEPVNALKTKDSPVNRYPTIIYHHGNGGIPFENSVLFEYLASFGYVIISSDYHWPTLRENSFTQKSSQSLEDVDFIVSFATTLQFTNPAELYYIGHSWGGGIGLRLNQRGNSPFKRFIILDSTIEQASLPEMKAINPHLDSLFHHHPNDFTTSTTVITSRGAYYDKGVRVVQPYPEFVPFGLIGTRAFTLLNMKEVLNHGSYTSVEVMRSVFTEEFAQSDSITVNQQFQTYQSLVVLIRGVLEGAAPDEQVVVIKNK